VVRDDQEAGKRVVAHVVTKTRGAAAALSQLQSHLRAQLPDQVPSGIVTMDSIPFTSMGTLDYRALPAPDWRPDLTGVFFGPRTPVEQVLCDLFEELLRIPRVSIRDSFFDLGGHSLLAILLVARVEEVLGRPLPLRALFEVPTVEGLALAL